MSSLERCPLCADHDRSSGVRVMEFESFKSSQAHLAVFPDVLMAIQKVGSAEALGQNVQHLAVHGLTAALGPLGFLAGLAAGLEELQKETPRAPSLESVSFEDLVRVTEVTAVAHGQLPKELRRAPRWPAEDWYRPVIVFPKPQILRIEVKWTSTVKWSMSEDEPSWRTEVNFWQVFRLRRTLERWGYPMR